MSTIVKEKKELERIDKIKSDAYNSGYFDAEKLLTANTDEDSEEFVEFLAEPEKFDPTSDTNESLSMMKDLEKQGVVVAYTDISKQDDKGTLGSSLYFKKHYSNDNFNGHIYSEEELQELTNRATGQYGEKEWVS